MSSMEVDLALNSRKFQAGIKDAEKELKNLSDEFDDLVDASEKVERAASEAMESTGDEADAAAREIKDLTERTEDLADEFRDAARRVDDLGDDADRAADKARRGFKRAEEGVEEFKDEAQQSARETAASFRDVEDGLDLVQEVAANAFSGFGPAGMVAGGVAATGIGLAVSAFEAMQEAEEESKERAREWGQAYIEAGSTVLDSLTRASIAQDILAERGDEVARNAENWGVNQATALAAMTGETWALEAAQRGINEGLAEHNEMLNELPYDDVGTNMGRLHNQWTDGQSALDTLNRELDGGAAMLDSYSQYLHAMVDNTEGAIRTTDEFGDTVVSLPDGHQVYIDAETGRATDNVEAIENRIYGLPDGHVNVTASTSSAERSLNDWINRRRTVSVQVVPYVRPGQVLPV